MYSALLTHGNMQLEIHLHESMSHSGDEKHSFPPCKMRERESPELCSSTISASTEQGNLGKEKRIKAFSMEIIARALAMRGKKSYAVIIDFCLF